MGAILWQPSPERVAATRLMEFMARASNAAGRALESYEDLHGWSVSDPGAFWQQLWEYAGVIASKPATAPVRDLHRFPGARWFEGAELNFAENLLRYRDARPALIAVLETGARRELSYAELYRQTACVAARLRELGVRPGDRVAGWLPNVPETVVAMLATASLGAVWSSCSPDFGAAGALDRFGQIEPRVLFACDGYFYNGRHIDTVDKVLEVAGQVSSIEQIIWIPLIDSAPAGAERFDALLAGEPQRLTFAQLPFDTPLYVLYSSGTTGKPKCIVHGAGGTLLQHLKEHQLHVDLKREDRLFFFTTCGWMMWNWLVSGLASGATLVLYDGSPFHPDPDTLWQMAEREGVTLFGTSARYLSALHKDGYVPRERHDLSRVRAILSTGSPLTDEGFRYVYESIKQDVHLASISGGTDLISCFVLGCPTLPVRAGEIQCAGLGMAVAVFDDDGRPLEGAKGELVCTVPFPSCPIGFWNDPNDEKFRAAYFSRFPGVWAHGDFAETVEHEGAPCGYVIHGRSDAVLNPGGVRIGTAEIYRQLERIEAISDAICVGQTWDGDTRVVLFVVMQPGAVLDDALRQRIRQQIRANASPRHVPAKILEVPEIPRTMSGKIVELAVRDVMHGRDVKNTAALANPEALRYFRDRPELEAD
ncbi:MAG: acetoacetate--CoA ligase [Pseudomonadales bacterium]